MLLLFGFSTLVYGQTDVEIHSKDAAYQDLVKGHVAWRTELSSPGASIQARQMRRDHSFVRYNLFVSGLPSSELYTALSWPVGQAKPSAIMEGITLGKDGIVMCAGRSPEQCGDPSKKDDPVDFSFNPEKGEPYRIALVAGNHRVAIIIVPDPIVAKDKGCTLSVERLLPHFELAYFTGSGFLPNSGVTFDSQSHGEERPVSTTSDNAGTFHFVLMPFVSGHRNGTTTIKGIGMTCSPSIKFDWGS